MVLQTETQSKGRLVQEFEDRITLYISMPSTEKELHIKKIDGLEIS
jgi:hypothetical protein